MQRLSPHRFENNLPVQWFIFFKRSAARTIDVEYAELEAAGWRRLALTKDPVLLGWHGLLDSHCKISEVFDAPSPHQLVADSMARMLAIIDCISRKRCSVNRHFLLWNGRQKAAWGTCDAPRIQRRISLLKNRQDQPCSLGLR